VTSLGIIIPQRASLFGVGTVRELLDLAPIAGPGSVPDLDQRQPTGRAERDAGTAPRRHDLRRVLTSRGAPGYIAANKALLDEELVAAGRDPGTFPVAAYHSINIGPDREACLDETVTFFHNYYGEGVFGRETASAMAAVGTVDECIEQLCEVRDEGATHIALRIASWNQREQLDLLIDKVLPGFLADD
jgi:alkanesulfonate monooxygenase SsuD/methylene tetrahydromethanopterin reductase-like flavin-dependent oxidoreductase (luciferase family)